MSASLAGCGLSIATWGILLEATHQSMYRDSDETLFRLFDLGEMEHVCRLVRQLGDPAPSGERAGLSESLRRLLLEPLHGVISRLQKQQRWTRTADAPVDECPRRIEVADGEAVKHRGASQFRSRRR